MILLMVDDEPIIIQTLARSISIESLNIEKILLAYSAEDAKRYFLNEPMIDLVMCDIEMPQTNGLALLSWIRANYPQTGCVFVTNYSVFQYAQEAIRLGCLDYILKPITPQQITASIEKCIDKLHHPDKDLYLNQYLQKESLWHDMLFSYISGHEYILPSQTMLDILYYPVLFIIDRQQCNNIQQVADLRYNVQKQIYTEVQTFSPHAVVFSYQLQNIFILFPCKVQYIEEVKQQIKNMYTALVKKSLPLLCVTGYNAKIPVLLGEMKDMLQLDLHGPQNIFEFAEVNESLLPKNSSLVYVVQNYIKEHLEQEICRNTVADYIHMNPDYLDRLFKKEFGLSVSQYIKEKKIDYAKMLLRTTNLSVSEIAQRLGYINLSHFTASFKQITNMTPVNYRKKY